MMQQAFALLSYTIDITTKDTATINVKIKPVMDLIKLGAVEVRDGVSPSSADGTGVVVVRDGVSPSSVEVEVVGSPSAVGGVVIMDPSPGISSE
jgi:hypothetical protein